MRKVAWRLSVLIVVASLSAAAPARAADEGEVGIHERVVRVTARATIPGVRLTSSTDPDGCAWQVVIEDDRLPVYDTDGTSLFSDTGRWFQRMCNGFGCDGHRSGRRRIPYVLVGHEAATRYRRRAAS